MVRLWNEDSGRGVSMVSEALSVVVDVRTLYREILFYGAGRSAVILI